ncbi:carboxylesterase [Immersiella caudata]|uniref:Carboxylic ester hydrolase n=1 Tax=Immersiella caudata TaxID=314043 RepID=A0AA40BTZ6_9PEZI|nr:carboxylesterase [Immersiella caudata]
MMWTLAPFVFSLGFLGSAISTDASLPAPVARQNDRWKVGQVVETSSGPVQGHPSRNFSHVSEYLGVPYAQPPIGNLRFQPPVKFSGTKAINASSYGSSCMASTISGLATNASDYEKLGLSQTGRDLIFGLTTPRTDTSEDCLTLNIWTKPQVGEAKKAVLLFIYGGGYVSGSSAVPWYDGAALVDEDDVVVVTFNYRISIFGFPGNPSTPNNLGMLDHRLAVEWVHDNIANFGGDPNRITLFGQSAGAASVDYYSYAWAKDPIIHAVIPMSGTAIGFGQQTAENATIAWFNLTARLGCGGASDNHDAVFKCMVEKPAQEVANAVPVNFITDSDNSLAYGPAVDEKLVFSDYFARKPAALPMLIGHTDFEAGLFRLLAPDFPDEIWTFINQVAYVCPSAIRSALSLALGNPTWRYRYFGDFPNLVLTNTPPSGAWHSGELPLLFNTTLASSGVVPDTPAQVEIGRYFRGAWATFAKDPLNGLTKYGWPQYSPNAPSLIRIGYNNQTGPNLAIGNLYDVDCPGLGSSAPNGSSSPNGTHTGVPSPPPTGTSSASGPSAPIFLITAIMSVVILF